MTFTVLDIGLLVLALAAVGSALWFRQKAAPELARLTSERDERAREIESLRAERDAVRARAEAAEREHAAGQAKIAEREKSFAREVEQMGKLQADGEARFKALADAALLRSQEQFVAIADETLKKHKEGAQGEFGAMLKPIQETFGQFREKVEAIEKQRSEDRAKLDEQLRQVGESTRLTQEVTGKLQSALAAPRGGGRWGEETLRNVLEIAGLSSYVDFEEQAGSTTETGGIRPDVIVKMPGGRHLVIDSKVSLDDYLAASTETDPVRRKTLLAAHAARVKAHVTALARKDYWKNIPDTVDFVAMFLPGENFYAAVLDVDRDIFDFAAKNNVIIVTPSTLIALAKSVAYGWRQEQMAKNAEQAAKLGRELYDRLQTLCGHMGRVGGGLGNAIKAYNELVGSMETRVLPSARKFEDLQFADPSKLIESPERVDLLPRQLTLLEGVDLGVKPEPKALAGSRRKAADG